MLYTLYSIVFIPKKKRLNRLKCENNDNCLQPCAQLCVNNLVVSTIRLVFRCYSWYPPLVVFVFLVKTSMVKTHGFM